VEWGKRVSEYHCAGQPFAYKMASFSTDCHGNNPAAKMTIVGLFAPQTTNFNPLKSSDS
jgi:hypothetical protein